MSELTRLLQQYQPNALAQDGPTYDTSNVLAGMPRPNPVSAALRVARDAIPENKDLPPPQFFMDPRSLSMANLLRGGLDTAAGWMDYGNKPQPNDYKPSEMLAPLGAGFMGSLVAPQNALGIFGGRLAKTADHNALEQAQEMATRGGDRKDIWDRTGWFKGADGEWRFEIDDSAAALKPWTAKHGQANETWPGRAGDVRPLDMSDYISHPELSRAYYPFEDVRSTGQIATLGAPEFKFSDVPGLRGSWNRRDGTITISNARVAEGPKEQLSTTLHELQHAVQDKEMFQWGGDPKLLADQEKQLSVLRRLMSQATEGVADPVKAQELRDAIYASVNNDRDALGLGHALYKRLAGEVEARNVQNRMHMTKEERRARPPWETEDVPASEQILQSYLK